MGLTTAPALPTPPAPTHVDGLRLFDEVLILMHQLGWQRLRVDTYNHPDQIWTIRHHYCHAEWEWYFEPDKYWNPHDTNGKLVRVRLSHPPLPSARQVLQNLLGITTTQILAAVTEYRKHSGAK